MSSNKSSSSSSNNTNNNNNLLIKASTDRSLLVLVVDVSPVAWGERTVLRQAQDKQRHAAGKRSVGPATLDELLNSIRIYSGAYATLQRSACIVVIGVAGDRSALVFPRKNALELFFRTGKQIDLTPFHRQLTDGVAELVARAAAMATPASTGDAAMASGVSQAFCIVNRFLVDTQRGVSALTNDSAGLFRKDDQGIVGMMSAGEALPKKSSMIDWSPRIMLFQASPDRSNDYNSMMNGVFAAVKHSIVIDACFLTSGSKSAPKSSSFLEQACDRTGGIYLSPSGAAQVDAALTEVLLCVFLAPRSARSLLNLPVVQKVDFRAQCFETGQSVDMAYVCNQCLSIFQKLPVGQCPTCQAEIKKKETKTIAPN
jgi:transcription initiation factor TFIIH subunit 3